MDAMLRGPAPDHFRALQGRAYSTTRNRAENTWREGAWFACAIGAGKGLLAGMHRDDILTAMALMRMPNFGARALGRVLQAAHANQTALGKWVNSNLEDLARAVEGRIAAAIVAGRPLDLRIEERVLLELEHDGGRACLATHATYPEALRTLKDPPPLLFLVGNEELLTHPAGAIAGARRASSEGLQCAVETARILAAQGVVVSGGAEGVDLAAHEAALAEQDGHTIVVLPQGILTYIAPECLLDGLERGRVLAMSESLPHDSWETYLAVSRNRIIAALARVVAIIEPRKTGGSVHTAQTALELGRPVFVWGNDEAGSAAGSLLRQGAQPLADEAGAARADALRKAMRAAPAPPPDDWVLF